MRSSSTGFSLCAFWGTRNQPHTGLSLCYLKLDDSDLAAIQAVAPAVTSPATRDSTSLFCDSLKGSSGLRTGPP